MTRPAEPVCGIVLSGGKSSRMGADKAALEIDGRTLLDAAQALLAECGCDPVLVSGRPDLANGFADSHPGGGPAHAILDAADAMPGHCRGLLFLPVDMPALTPADLDPLMSGDARAAHWEGFQLPLFLRADFARPDRSETWSIRKLIGGQSARIHAVPETQADRFENLNTPEAFNRFRHGR